MQLLRTCAFICGLVIAWGAATVSGVETEVPPLVTAEILAAEGYDAYHNFDFPKALNLFRRALWIFQQSHATRDMIVTLLAIGDIQYQRYAYQSSLEAFQQAYASAQADGLTFYAWWSLRGIGDAYRAQMLLLDALQAYAEAHKALQVASREQTEPSAPDDLRVYENLILVSIANTYSDLGQYWNAVKHYQEALALSKHTANSEQEAEILRDYGATALRFGRYAEALERSQEALRIFQDELSDRENTAVVLTAIGGIYEELGRQERAYFVDALDHYQRAFVEFSTLSRTEDEGIVLNNIGKTLDAMGAAFHRPEKYHQALAYYQQAVTIFDAIPAQELRGNTRANLGEVHLHLSAHEQPEEHLHKASAYLQEALNIQEHFDPARRWVTLSLMGAVSERLGDADAAITRSREAIAALEPMIRDAGLSELKISVRDQAEDAYQRAIRLSMANPRTHQQAFEYSERARARAFLDQLGASTRPSQSPEDAALISEETLSLKEIQARLDATTTILAYVVTPEATFAFVVGRSFFEAIQLPIAQQDLFTRIERARRPADAQLAPPSEDFAWLYARLIAPVKPWLTTPNLVIIPHGALHYLPFAALTDGKRYVGDEYVLSLLPSASMLKFFQTRPDGPTDILAFAANTAPGYPPLQYAEQEAQVFRHRFPGRIFLGQQATESLVKKLAGTAGILLLSGHGRLDTEIARNSSIFLSADDANDGRLTVDEISGLKLRDTELVILSACETQLGHQSKGDDIVGLTRAFLNAGAQAVISSVWSVPDEATYHLMTSFARHLQAGRSPAQALQAAQRRVRARYPHPYYWAGFALTGNPGAPSAQFPVIPVVLAVAGLVGIVGLVAWRRRSGKRTTRIEFRKDFLRGRPCNRYSHR